MEISYITNKYKKRSDAHGFRCELNEVAGNCCIFVINIYRTNFSI